MPKSEPKIQHLIVSRWVKHYRTVDIYQDVINVDGQFVVWSVKHKRELGTRRDKSTVCEQMLVRLGYREAMVS